MGLAAMVPGSGDGLPPAKRRRRLRGKQPAAAAPAAAARCGSLPPLRLRLLSVAGASLAELEFASQTCTCPGATLAVAEIKAAVHDRLGIPSTDQHLVLEGRVLEGMVSRADLEVSAREGVVSISLVRCRPLLVVSGGDDHTLRLWNVERSEPVVTMTGHIGPVSCVQVDWSCRRALSGSTDGSLRLWDLERGECLKAMLHRGQVLCSAADWSGGRALSGGSDAALRLWELPSGRLVRTLRGHESGVLGMAADWQGGRALSASCDGALLLWDIPEAGDPAPKGMPLLPRARRPALTCVEADWGRQRAAIGGFDGTVSIWDLAEHVRLQILQVGGMVFCLAVDWSRGRILAGALHAPPKLWDLATGVCKQTLSGHEGLVRYLIADGTGGDKLRALTACSDGIVRLWDLEAGCCSHVLSGHFGAVTCLAVEWGAG